MSNKKAKGSNTTTPLSLEQVVYILDELNDVRDYRMVALVSLLFRCVRIGDALRTITIADIFNQDGSIKSELNYTEEKTGKSRIIPLQGDRLTTALELLYPTIKHKNRDSTLFYAAKLINKPLSDSGVKSILNKFVGKRGITQCSPHSLRKGGARTMHNKGVSISKICNVLNHHSQKTTEIYIGITSEDVAEAMEVLAI